MSLVDNISLHESTVAKNIETNMVSVHKFGGSSLKDAQAIDQVLNIIESNCCSNDFVVLSAMGKTTDLLISLVEKYKQIDKACDNDIEIVNAEFEALRKYQSTIISEVLVESKASLLLHELENDLQRIEYLLSRTILFNVLLLSWRNFNGKGSFDPRLRY